MISDFNYYTKSSNREWFIVARAFIQEHRNEKARARNLEGRQKDESRGWVNGEGCQWMGEGNGWVRGLRRGWMGKGVIRWEGGHCMGQMGKGIKEGAIVKSCSYRLSCKDWSTITFLLLFYYPFGIDIWILTILNTSQSVWNLGRHFLQTGQST